MTSGTKVEQCASGPGRLGHGSEGTKKSFGPNSDHVPSEPRVGRWPGDAKRSHGTKDLCAFLGLKVAKWPGGLTDPVAPIAGGGFRAEGWPGQANRIAVTKSQNACPGQGLGSGPTTEDVTKLDYWPAPLTGGTHEQGRAAVRKAGGGVQA